MQLGVRSLHIVFSFHLFMSPAGVSGHRDLWLSGALHRNIGVGNILIVEEGKHRGSLIGPGHSKVYSNWTHPPCAEDQSEGACARMVERVLEDTGMIITDEQAVNLLNRYRNPSDAVYYIGRAQEISADAVRASSFEQSQLC